MEQVWCHLGESMQSAHWQCRVGALIQTIILPRCMCLFFGNVKKSSRCEQNVRNLTVNNEVISGLYRTLSDYCKIKAVMTHACHDAYTAAIVAVCIKPVKTILALSHHDMIHIISLWWYGLVVNSNVIFCDSINTYTHMDISASLLIMR